MKNLFMLRITVSWFMVVLAVFSFFKSQIVHVNHIIITPKIALNFCLYIRSENIELLFHCKVDAECRRNVSINMSFFYKMLNRIKIQLYK